MIEILSLPRRPNANLLQNVKVRFTGLPINSLPGWEQIPLNCKLPMLRCPGNQVIFSKNKIGQSFKRLKQEFDPSARDKIPEYNPLHDTNLKDYYANQQNLKRLRVNGEITEDNDVICTLKDFNEYRQQLHRSQLYYLLQEMRRVENEQRDRVAVVNAETIAGMDHANLRAREHSHGEVAKRKIRRDAERAARFRQLAKSTEEKFQRIAVHLEMREAMWEHRKVLNHMKMEQHKEVCRDLERKQMISLKKLFAFKKERLNKNVRLVSERKKRKAEDSMTSSWDKRLTERINNQAKITKIMSEEAARRQQFIQNHITKYREKWEKIQEQIKKLTREKNRELMRLTGRLHKKKKRKRKEPRTLACIEYQQIFEELLDTDLCAAVNTAIGLEEDKIPFNPDDPIYKAAKFIMQHIVEKFDKDLSCDKATFKSVKERIENFFQEAKRFVLFRATQIIAAARSSPNEAMAVLKDEKAFEEIGGSVKARRCSGMGQRVSFNNDSRTIGFSSYEIHPLIDLRHVGERTPTPAGSLASLVVESHGTLVNKTKAPHLCRYEEVFVEHFVVKFKRELIVGMGKRVFAAIQAHFENKIMDVRKELVDLDRDFLANQITKAILSYAVNPLNFESSTQLAISALSSEIIRSLQQYLLRPERDPRGIVSPRPCCHSSPQGMKLCMYCHAEP